MQSLLFKARLIFYCCIMAPLYYMNTAFCMMKECPSSSNQRDKGSAVRQTASVNRTGLADICGYMNLSMGCFRRSLLLISIFNYYSF
jgi:hypothetical protein